MKLFNVDKITFNIEPDSQCTIGDLKSLLAELDLKNKDLEVSIVESKNGLLALSVSAKTHFNFNEINEFVDYINSKAE